MHSLHVCLAPARRQPRAPVRRNIRICSVRCALHVGQDAVAEQEEHGDNDQKNVGAVRVRLARRALVRREEVLLLRPQRAPKHHAGAACAACRGRRGRAGVNIRVRGCYGGLR